MKAGPVKKEQRLCQHRKGRSLDTRDTKKESQLEAVTMCAELRAGGWLSRECHIGEAKRALIHLVPNTSAV